MSKLLIVLNLPKTFPAARRRHCDVATQTGTYCGVSARSLLLFGLCHTSGFVRNNQIVTMRRQKAQAEPRKLFSQAERCYACRFCYFNCGVCFEGGRLPCSLVAPERHSSGGILAMLLIAVHIFRSFCSIFATVEVTQRQA